MAYTLERNVDYWYGASPLSDYPFTLFAWGYSTNDNYNALLSLNDVDQWKDYFQIQLMGSGATPSYGGATAFSNGSETSAVTSTSGGLNAWHNFCGVHADATTHAIYLNGGGKGTNAASITGHTLDRITIGAQGTASSFYNPWGGRIAEIAIWSADLTDAEVAILGLGYSPLFVRPANLVAYFPLIRDTRDIIGNLSLTTVGSPTVATDHPPVIYPAPPFLSFPVAAVGGVDITVPVAALEITGYAPTVATPVNVTVPVGVLEIIGYAPVVTTTANVDIEIPTGSLEIAGYAPIVTITGNIDIEVPIGVLEIEGYAPTIIITANIDIEVPTGALEITGYVPMVTTTGSVDITVPVASLVLTGYAPTVTTFAGTVELFLWNRAASLQLNERTPELVVGERTTELVLEEK